MYAPSTVATTTLAVRRPLPVGVKTTSRSHVDDASSRAPVHLSVPIWKSVGLAPTTFTERILIGLNATFCTEKVIGLSRWPTTIGWASAPAGVGDRAGSPPVPDSFVLI